MELTTIPTFAKEQKISAPFLREFAAVVGIRPVVGHYYEVQKLEWLLDMAREVRERYEEHFLQDWQVDLSVGKEE